MAEIIIMPKLGFNMDEGKLVKWYKAEGESVKKGEPLFSVETDKTNMDIEATGDGVLLKTFLEEGGKVPVTLPIAIVGEAGENIDALVADALAQLGDDAPAAAAAPAPAAAAAPAAAPAPAAEASGRDFEIVVLGGGPGGYVAAIKAAQLGKKTAIVEKDSFGGTCLNRGCIPTKAFLRSAENLKEVQESAKFGVIDAEVANAKLDMKKVLARKQEVVGQLVGGVNGLLKGNGVTIFNGRGVVVDKNTIEVDGKAITTDNIIVATGSVPWTPIKIDPAMPQMTSDEILEMDYIPEEIVVLGGGVIAIEFAYFLAVAGCKVTVLELRPYILSPTTDEEICTMVAADLTKMGVNVITSAGIKEVTKDAVIYEKDGKEEVIKTNLILVATGRRATTDGVDCEKLGIKTAKNGAIITDEYMKTSVPGIYAIGDVNGKAMLAHVASMEGIVAVENICGHAAVMEYDKVPGCIYLQPEVASVGLTEAQAKEKYGNVKVGKFPLAGNGKAKVAGDQRGIMKVIVEPKYHEVVGVHLYCIHASDMIAEAVAIMKMEGTAEELTQTIHPHPTVSEIYHEAFHAAIEKAIHWM